MSVRIIIAVIVVGGLCGGCRRAARKSVVSNVAEATDVVQSKPLSSPTSSGSSLFRKRTPDETGIDLAHKFPDHASVDLLSDQTSGAGVCIGDVDGDGLPDIYVTNYDQGNRLYRNLGGFRFEDVTQQAGVGGEGRWCSGASFVDIDNDGDLDLHVCAYGSANLLYENDGSGKFSEAANRFGLAISAASVMMSFADYDLDGDLDGYLVTNRLVTNGKKHRLPKNSQTVMKSGIVQVKRGPDGRRAIGVSPDYKDLFEIMPKGEQGRFELIIAGQEDQLLRNDQGVFVSANSKVGIEGHGIGLAATWWDYNRDGRPDLYVSNDYKGADQLYRNNADGTFTDVVEEICPHVPWYSMGADIGDINNDGWMDLFASDMSGTSHYRQKISMGDMSDDAWFLDQARPQQYMRNAMFVNSGGGRMLEAAKMAGVSSSDWTWSPKFGDFDNDGLIDLFIANGMSRDFMHSDLANVGDRGSEQWKDQPVMREKNLAFRNRGRLEFEEVGNAWGLDELSASYGASLADLDRDGDLDLIATNFDGPLLVYENQSKSGKRLLIQLVGQSSNRNGVGARVTIDTSLGQQTRCMTTAEGFMSSNEPILHFGLGDATIELMTVHWPSGIVQRVDEVSVDHLMTIVEPAATEPESAPPVNSSNSTLFTLSDRFSNFRHRERPFDDFATQPLLPAKKSQRGPGIACGDINGDGADDFYLGGAAGTAGEIVIGKSCKVLQTAVFAADAECEDMGAVFFDADSDGDLDLYVVSGGVESKLGSRQLQDRLYLQTNGEFTKIDDSLPVIAESGSCVCAADFDRDGDLDLFVGGHVVPGSYPESSPSRLLRNEGGKFSDVTKLLAPELANASLVNAALWTDANNDGALDLLVAQEWGTVDVYLNRNGRLGKSDATGLTALTGWWSGIAGRDIDHDGDIDYVVTNAGLNTKYHADVDHPVRLYSGVFDSSGKRRIVEAKYENDTLLPERGKSCSTSAIPGLSTRFKTFEDFAVAGLEDVYTEERLSEAIKLSATTLESGVLINDGSAQFEFRPLPRMAQISPSNGVSLVHVDKDSHCDLVLAQNDFSPQRETGRMAGGVSLVLRGDGKGGFEPTWPHESNVSVTGDAQCVSVSDLNGDHRPDLLFGVNDQPWQAYESNSSGKQLAVRLNGLPGNPNSIGARVEVLLSTTERLTQEIYAGDGYLSQRSSELFFSLGTATVQSIHVHWPDGENTTIEKPTTDSLLLEHPSKK